MHISIHSSLEKYEYFCRLYYYDLLKNLQYRQGLTTESSMMLKGSNRLLQFRKKRNEKHMIKKSAVIHVALVKLLL